MSAGDPRTAEAGAELLRQGGNAVDAAVGAAFAAMATEPILASAFGGGFATLAGPGRAPETWDFFAEVPGRGLQDALKDPELDFVSIEVSFGPSSQVFHCGRGATAVPLLLPGLVELQARAGRLERAQVVAPALALARQGVPVSPEIAGILKILKKIVCLSKESRELFAPSGAVLQAGETYRLPKLPALLERLAAGGRVPGREELLAGFGPPLGRITSADLDAAKARRTTPVQVTLNLPSPAGQASSAALNGGSSKVQIYLPPPPGTGGLLIAFSLRLLEDLPRSTWGDPMACVDHFLAVMAVANQARRASLDPLLHAGLDPSLLAQRFLSDEQLAEYRPRFARAVHQGPDFEEAVPDNLLGRTTHVSSMDSEGLVCALTHSNGEGCGYMVPGTSQQANNFLGEEDLHPEGFHLDPPGTRLTSMMCPTIACREGRPILAIGSGGSNRIRTAILQVLVRHLFAGESLKDAILAPRMHLEGGVLNIEAAGYGRAFSTQVLNHLENRVPNLAVFDAPSMFFGGAHAVGEGGQGVGDPRRGGAVARV